MQRQLWLALALALLAAAFTYYYINEKEAAVQAGVTPLKVLVAKKPVNRGQPLTADKVLIEDIPGAYIMPGSVSAPVREGVIKQWEEIKGQFALVPIAKGEQILPNKLSRLRPGFAGLVPEGMRICSFGFDRVQAVGGHVQPGNRVDVLGIFEHQYQNAKRTTTVVLAQNLLVTAVGGETVSGNLDDKLDQAMSSGPGTLPVSLALTPDDALRLSLAEQEGRLKLALRAPDDDHLLDLSDQNLGSVLGPLMKVRREEIKSAPRTFEIIRGLQK